MEDLTGGRTSLRFLSKDSFLFASCFISRCYTMPREQITEHIRGFIIVFLFLYLHNFNQYFGTC